MRFDRTFKTKEDRAAWEKDMRKHEGFKVCFRLPVRELEKEVFLPQEVVDEYKYAVVYRWEENEQ